MVLWVDWVAFYLGLWEDLEDRNIPAHRLAVDGGASLTGYVSDLCITEGPMIRRVPHLEFIDPWLPS